MLMNSAKEPTSTPFPLCFFDTTLRDGIQGAGIKLSLKEKVTIAEHLTHLGIDVLEVGYPGAVPGDGDVIRTIAAAVGTQSGPVICSLARAQPEDIQAAAQALQPARKARIHTYISTSEAKKEVINTAREMVSLAKELVGDVEFSPMHATLSDPVFVVEVLAAVIAAGATTISIADTMGTAFPHEIAHLIQSLQQLLPELQGVVLSIHGDNDLGMAVANSLEAIRQGVRQVEGTFLGIGPRAGNTALEEVILAIHRRPEVFNPAHKGDPSSLLPAQIKADQLSEITQKIARILQIPIPPYKPVVGHQIPHS
jgi:2-isopropylmalate synthase